MLKCANHSDNTTVTSPLSGIVNVALADPTSLSINPKSGYLWSNRAKAWVFGSLMGRTTYYSSGGISQICVTPFSEGWYRFAAVLAEVCEHHTILFQSFKGGVTFGTSRMKGHGNTSGISAPGKQKEGRRAPVRGSTIFNDHEGAQHIPFVPFVLTLFKCQSTTAVRVFSWEIIGNDVTMVKCAGAVLSCSCFRRGKGTYRMKWPALRMFQRT